MVFLTEKSSLPIFHTERLRMLTLSDPQILKDVQDCLSVSLLAFLLLCCCHTLYYCTFDIFTFLKVIPTWFFLKKKVLGSFSSQTF